MNPSLILDASIALLLIITVIYCWKLSRKISLLHDGKDALNHFIADFNNAILRAEGNIDELKTLGSQTDDKLTDHIQKARFLANDLAFLMNKGEHVADNIERQINASRIITTRPPAQAKRARPPMPAKQAPEPVDTNISTETIADNFVAPVNTQAPEKTQIHPPVAQSHTAPESAMSPSKKQALDDVLANIANRKIQANAPSEQATTGQAAQDFQAPNRQTLSQSATVNPFDKRKLTETLSATQGD